MKKPWYRKQSGSWVVSLPGGRIKTLGKDPHGETRKHPPRAIEEAWHALDRQRKPKDMLFCDVADKYVDYLENPKSKASAREQLDWFMEFAGKKVKVSDLRVHDVTEYLKTKKTWGDGSKATAVARITAALNWARNEGLIEEHAVQFAKGKKPRYRNRETIMTDDQQHAIETMAYPELRRILIALRESGCRPGEMCRLTIDKVNLAERVATVKNKTARKTGKAGRDVYLSAALVELIREAIGTRTEGPVFLNTRGRAWDSRNLSHRVQFLRDKLGLPKDAVVYGYRHAYISGAVNDTDANVALIARQVGHSNLNMMMRTYLHESPDAMRRTVDKIAEKVSAARKSATDDAKV